MKQFYAIHYAIYKKVWIFWEPGSDAPLPAYKVATLHKSHYDPAVGSNPLPFCPPWDLQALTTNKEMRSATESSLQRDNSMLGTY